MTAGRRTAVFFFVLFAVTLALRLCHSRILWVDEDYHIAAGIQTLDGHMLYRDVWYDKPPLAAWVYAAMGGVWGWPLRLFDALYVLGICGAMYRFARDLWGTREAFLAAALLAFFLNFDLAFAVIPVAPDLFLMLPHIAAVHCAWRGRPFAAGLWCGVAFLFHTKGVFVLAMCALLAFRSLPALLAGFAIPNAAAFAVLAAGGAIPDYLRQVWEWGAAYARNSPVTQPVLNALRRTLAWFGFHALLALGAAWFGWMNRRRECWWLAAWFLISFAGVALGMRFSPRYFFLLLPPLVLMAARAPWLCPPRTIVLAAAAVALLVPLVRFGPRYVTLAQDLLRHREHRWVDLVLDQDSQVAAARLNALKRPGDTLLVWGYRPDIFVYTRLGVASRYWDSQPLTGVPADRHLHDALSIIPEWAARNRAEVAGARPTFVVDSLSLSNAGLAISAYPELRPWLARYEVAARTPLSVIYRLRR